MIIISALIVLLPLLYQLYYHLPEYLARKHWEDACEKIDAGLVETAVITGYQIRETAIDVENCLAPEDFDRALPPDIQASPGTPDYTIDVAFSDHSGIMLQYIIGGLGFSAYYRKSFYEIDNAELAGRVQAIAGFSADLLGYN